MKLLRLEKVKKRSILVPLLREIKKTKRIEELEKEVALLKEKNEKLLGRNFGGRKKHDETVVCLSQQKPDL